MSPLFRSVFRDFRSCWKTLVVTDIIYKIIAFIVLTPLVAILFRLLMTASGATVLSDQDILFFFLGPSGWLCLITVGGLWLGIVALELAALMGILATSDHHRIRPIDAIGFAKDNAMPVVKVTARLVAYTLLTVAPFLVVAGGVYFALLTEFDINYYLTEKPPVFLVALAIGGVIVLTLIGVLLRLFTGWFYSLPLVLFEDVASSKALQVSRERATGHRLTLGYWIFGWGLASAVLSSLLTGMVVGLGRIFVPRAAGSLGFLTMALGASLLLWAIISLAVNLLSTTLFAVIQINLYRTLGGGDRIAPPRIVTAENNWKGFGIQLTPKGLIALCIVGSVIAFAIGGFALRTMTLEDHVEIMAHRGSSKLAPENTMAAIKTAIEEGADWVEIDVQETADGNVVVFHDSDFMKLGGVDLKIWDATMADLEDLDVGSWFDPKFKDERVPTLGEVLDACKGKAGVNIELKYYGHDVQLEQRVVDIVKSHDMISEVVVMSLKNQGVEKVKSIEPDLKVGLLMSVSAGDLKRIQADFLAINASFAKRRLIQTAHKIGKEVYVWTVNDAVTMSTMMGRGVEGLITDKPALARSVLEARAMMSPAERLLLELAGIFGLIPEIEEQ